MSAASWRRSSSGSCPAGNYAIIKGNQADANADFLRAGMEEVIGEAVAAGDIVIQCETYTDNWDPANAQANMEQCLTSTNNEIDAVLSENDGMAGGVVAALDAQGMAGTIPVSGPGRRQGRTEPRRPRHADRLRLEGRPQPGQGSR